MISAVILTKNEEKNILDCLKSVSWCGEVIVIDDYSSDSTVRVAQGSGAKVYLHRLDGNFAGQRNFGLTKAKGEWVLFVDADERIPTMLRDELSSLDFSTLKGVAGFYIKRNDVVWGKELKHGEVGNTWLLRFARKNSGLWRRRVHEYWDVRGDIRKFDNPLLHFPHQTLRLFVEEIDFYSTLHAQQKYEEGERSSLIKIILWPKIKFFNNWIFKLGFLDGTEGFVHAVTMSFHSFLAWSKLWLLEQKSVNASVST